MPDAERRIFFHECFATFAGNVLQGVCLEKMFDDGLHGMDHYSSFYQLEKSLLKISSVRLLTIVGNNWASASVMEVVAAKSKFLVTSASKSAGATFFPVGSR